MSTVRLTEQVKAAGCASKLSPKILDQILRRLPAIADENVLVGYETSDDAGVYRIDSNTALVQTVDFFTPVVDDPFDYGAIAAANALSDVYAMGGRPITALTILAYPGKGDLEVLEQILRGGLSKMTEASCPVVGGHSVNVDEVKFGYAVTGLVHPDCIWTNAGARVGDLLVFTKRIGTGVIGTALKRGIAREAHVAAAVESMLTLNRRAAAAVEGLAVHACTDVTGFGLLGHAREMALGSSITLEIDSNLVPLLDGALEYTAAGAIPGGLRNNQDFVECAVSIENSVPATLALLLCDPQTSGGLLVSLTEADATLACQRYSQATIIGRVVERGETAIRVT